MVDNITVTASPTFLLLKMDDLGNIVTFLEINVYFGIKHFVHCQHKTNYKEIMIQYRFLNVLQCLTIQLNHSENDSSETWPKFKMFTTKLNQVNKDTFSKQILGEDFEST